MTGSTNDQTGNCIMRERCLRYRMQQSSALTNWSEPKQSRHGVVGNSMWNANTGYRLVKQRIPLTAPRFGHRRKQGNMSDKTITVCNKCLRACCWNGIFMCDDAQTAGTVEKTIAELKALDLEHPDYWDVRTYQTNTPPYQRFGHRRLR